MGNLIIWLGFEVLFPDFMDLVICFVLVCLCSAKLTRYPTFIYSKALTLTCYFKKAFWIPCEGFFLATIRQIFHSKKQIGFQSFLHYKRFSEHIYLLANEDFLKCIGSDEWACTVFRTSTSIKLRSGEGSVHHPSTAPTLENLTSR